VPTPTAMIRCYVCCGDLELSLDLSVVLGDGSAAQPVYPGVSTHRRRLWQDLVPLASYRTYATAVFNAARDRGQVTRIQIRLPKVFHNNVV
jgi:hypothetical protein